MIRIPYSCGGFPQYLGSKLQGGGVCSCTWENLIRAAITVGKADRTQLLLFGRSSWFEILYRTAIVYANLGQTPNGYIRRTEAYDRLDPSEKGAVSYFLGLTAAKLMAEKLLGVSWLMHLDVYAGNLDPVIAFGKLRPDLVGMNKRRRWVVVEAKGRTNSFSLQALQKGKTQTRNLRRIAGDYPDRRVVTESYFDSGVFRVALEDPEGSEHEAVDVEVDPERLLRDYYQPFISLLTESPGPVIERRVENQVYLLVRLDEGDLTVGVSRRVFGAFEGNRLAAELIGPSDHEVREPAEDHATDEVHVELGGAWVESLMLLDPSERTHRDVRKTR